MFARNTVLSLMAAIVLAGAQHYGASPIALVALVPWLAATQRGGPVASVAIGALMGTAYGCLVAVWMPEALRALGSSEPTAITGLFVTAAWAKAPIFAVLGLIAWLVRRTSVPAFVACIAAGVFAIENAVSKASWGVPWAMIGHSQLAMTGVSQLAVSGGVPLISALVTAVNAAAARLFGADPSAATRTCVALAAGWASLVLFGLPLAQAVRPVGEDPTEQLLVLQPDIPRGERWGDDLQALNLQRVKSFFERSEPGDLTGVSAILLPENLLTTPVDTTPDLLFELQSWVDRVGIPVVSGLAMAPREKARHLYRSSVVWIEPGRGITARIDKGAGGSRAGVEP